MGAKKEGKKGVSKKPAHSRSQNNFQRFGRRRGHDTASRGNGQAYAPR